MRNVTWVLQSVRRHAIDEHGQFDRGAIGMADDADVSDDSECTSGVQRGFAGRMLGTGHGHAEVGARDHLHVVRAAAADPAVVDADDREAVCLCFCDGRLCGMVHSDHADVVAAIVHYGYVSFAHGTHVTSRLSQLRVFGDIQDFRQARIFIAAQGRVERVLGDDARLLEIVAEPAERLPCEGARFFH